MSAKQQQPQQPLYTEHDNIITHQLKNYAANQVQKDNTDLGTLSQCLELDNANYTSKNALINDMRNTTNIIGGSYVILELGKLISLIYTNTTLCINIKKADANNELKHCISYHFQNGKSTKEFNSQSNDNVDEGCELTIGLLYGKLNSKEYNHYDLLFTVHEQNKLLSDFIKEEGNEANNYKKFSIYGDGNCLYTAIAAHLEYISGLTKEQAIKLALYGRNEDEVPTPESTSGKPTPAPVSKLPLQLSPDMSKKLKDMLNDSNQYLEEKIYEEIPEEDINNIKLDKLCTYDLIKDLLFQKFNVLSSAVPV